jgi:hypothetical protein
MWKCKIHAIPILGHHIHISTTFVYSIMLKPKRKIEIRNVMIEKSTRQTNCLQMGLDLSTATAMHEGDNGNPIRPPGNYIMI